MARLLIVSNRLPVTVSVIDGRPDVSPSPGGLATGLTGPHERSDGLWIGWPGKLSELDPEQWNTLERRLAEARTVPVHVSDDEFEGFYTGLSNGVLWPLFHYLVDRVPLQPRDWEAYRAVNARFAEVVVQHYRPGDLIWVHDYQLALVPALIRARLPEAKIGFFLHIPFPASEVFRLFPWREQFLRGLLGADVVGFHTFSYVRQFNDTLMHLLGLPSAVSVAFEGREVRLWAYPMGVDARALESHARDPEIQAEADKLRAELGDTRLLLGVDRLDYTKGIPRRLLAIERLLEREPGLQGKLRFVQVAVPSREGVPQYDAFVSDVQQLVGRINGRFSTPSSVPIHFLHQGFSQRQLVAFYKAADAVIVTSLRDGMNLVAKEFVASRSDEDGVLVLSEFAGAASEMGEAVLVNPYDIETTATAIGRALSMKPKERTVRMRALRERVFAYDVHRWAAEFIADLEAARPQKRPAKIGPQPSELRDQVRRAERVLWILDYDGTLAPFAERPELAEPDEELVALLAALASDPRSTVHVVSGRRYDMLGEWLGGLPVGLHAEHGLWSREPGGEWKLNHQVDLGWKDTVRPVLRDFSLRTPGSLIEEKTASLAFHYRMADVEFGEWQARELQVHLTHLLSNVPVEVLPGNKVLEVKPHRVNKGTIVPKLLQSSPGALVVAAGDDHTDEYLFRALPRDAVSICVGSRPSAARFSLPGVAAMLALLRQIIADR
jgi:trehalose 6-phosphate synthase/phosphatase